MKLALLLLLAGCATVHTAEGQREVTRDAIHARLVWCVQRADEEKRVHGRDALAELRCEADAAQECTGAGLESACGEWQWGGT